MLLLTMLACWLLLLALSVVLFSAFDACWSELLALVLVVAKVEAVVTLCDGWWRCWLRRFVTVVRKELDGVVEDVCVRCVNCHFHCVCVEAVVRRIL